MTKEELDELESKYGGMATRTGKLILKLIREYRKMKERDEK